jgi:hypothetical protein
MSPAEMIENVLPIKREDVWDLGGIGGLLRGKQFEELIHKFLPVKTFEETSIPLAVTTFDCIRMKTHIIQSGDIAIAARTSCTFPGLFQPVIVNGTPHIDGGVWDNCGIYAMEANLRAEKVRKLMKAKGENYVDAYKAYHNKHKNQHQHDQTTREIEEAYLGKEYKIQDDADFHNKLIVNITFGTPNGSVLPKSLSHCRVSTNRRCMADPV